MQRANVFRLRGSRLTIDYSSTSLTGEPIMAVERQGVAYDFRGAEIQLLQTPIGTLATVVLEQTPDLETLLLTLVLPDVNVDQRNDDVEAFAVLTTSRTSIAGPQLVKGQIQTYRRIRLRGSAEHVVF